MRNFCFLLAIFCLATLLNSCGLVKESSLMYQTGYGEQAIVRQDSSLPESVPDELLSYFKDLKHLRNDKDALRIPTGIKSIHLMDDQIIVQAKNNHIWCLDAKTLLVDWKWNSIIGELSYPPAANDYNIYFVARDRLYAVSRITGKEQWRFSTPFSISSPPTASGLYVFMGSWDKRVYCISDQITRASVVWFLSLDSPVVTAPMAADIQNSTWVHVLAKNGTYYKLRPTRNDNRSHKNVYAFESGSKGPMAFDDKLSFIASTDYNVYGMDPRMGPVWVLRTENPCISGCYIKDDQLYVRNTDSFFAINTNDGKVLWSDPALDSFVTKMKRYSYFLTNNNKITGVENKTQERKWTKDLGPIDFVLPSPEINRLFVATKEGYILSLEEKY